MHKYDSSKISSAFDTKFENHQIFIAFYPGVIKTTHTILYIPKFRLVTGQASKIIKT